MSDAHRALQLLLLRQHLEQARAGHELSLPRYRAGLAWVQAEEARLGVEAAAEGGLLLESARAELDAAIPPTSADHGEPAPSASTEEAPAADEPVALAPLFDEDEDDLAVLPAWTPPPPPPAPRFQLLCPVCEAPVAPDALDCAHCQQTVLVHADARPPADGA